MWNVGVRNTYFTKEMETVRVWSTIFVCEIHVKFFTSDYEFVKPIGWERFEFSSPTWKNEANSRLSSLSVWSCDMPVKIHVHMHMFTRTGTGGNVHIHTYMYIYTNPHPNPHAYHIYMHTYKDVHICDLTCLSAVWKRNLNLAKFSRHAQRTCYMILFWWEMVIYIRVMYLLMSVK